MRPDASGGADLQGGVLHRLLLGAGDRGAHVEGRAHFAHHAADVIGASGAGIGRRQHAHLVGVDPAECLHADVEVFDAAAVEQLAITEERLAFLEKRAAVGDVLSV